MVVLNSSVDPLSPEFRANEKAMEENISLLRELTSKARLGGGETARDRHIGRDKMLVRDRIDTLLDPGSPFLEFSPLGCP